LNIAKLLTKSVQSSNKAGLSNSLFNTIWAVSQQPNSWRENRFKVKLAPTYNEQPLGTLASTNI